MRNWKILLAMVTMVGLFFLVACGNADEKEMMKDEMMDQDMAEEEMMKDEMMDQDMAEEEMMKNEMMDQDMAEEEVMKDEMTDYKCQLRNDGE